MQHVQRGDHTGLETALMFVHILTDNNIHIEEMEQLPRVGDTLVIRKHVHHVTAVQWTRIRKGVWQHTISAYRRPLRESKNSPQR